VPRFIEEERVEGRDTWHAGMPTGLIGRDFMADHLVSWYQIRSRPHLLIASELELSVGPSATAREVVTLNHVFVELEPGEARMCFHCFGGPGLWFIEVRVHEFRRTGVLHFESSDRAHRAGIRAG